MIEESNKDNLSMIFNGAKRQEIILNERIRQENAINQSQDLIHLIEMREKYKEFNQRMDHYTNELKIRTERFVKFVEDEKRKLL